MLWCYIAYRLNWEMWRAISYNNTPTTMAELRMLIPEEKKYKSNWEYAYFRLDSIWLTVSLSPSIFVTSAQSSCLGAYDWLVSSSTDTLSDASVWPSVWHTGEVLSCFRWTKYPIRYPEKSVWKDWRGGEGGTDRGSKDESNKREVKKVWTERERDNRERT